MESAKGNDVENKNQTENIYIEELLNTLEEEYARSISLTMELGEGRECFEEDIARNKNVEKIIKKYKKMLKK